MSAIKTQENNYRVGFIRKSNQVFQASNVFLQVNKRVKDSYEERIIEIEEKKAEEELERLRAEEERLKKELEEEKKQLELIQSYSNGSGLTKSSGVNWYNGWRETYYSSRVLYHYMTPQWTAGSDGVYRDSDGYVIVSSSSESYGTITDTSFGAGKVYDTGCPYGTHDIYVNW